VDALPFIRSGKVRPLAVASHQRLPALPDVPTFEDAGVKWFYTDSWYGLVAPANTPRPALEKLNAALNQALREPELQKQFSEQGSLLVKPMGVDEYWTFVKKQMPIAAEQVRISGAKANQASAENTRELHSKGNVTGPQSWAQHHSTKATKAKLSARIVESSSGRPSSAGMFHSVTAIVSQRTSS